MIAAGWTVLSYLNTARIDYSKGFADKQIEVLFQTSEAAAKLLVAKDAAWPTAEAKFWKLYWGPLTLFENNSIACPMIGLAVLILENSQRPGTEAMKAKVNNVTSAIRKYIDERNGSNWRFTLQDVLTIAPDQYNNPKTDQIGPCVAAPQSERHSGWWQWFKNFWRD